MITSSGKYDAEYDKYDKEIYLSDSDIYCEIPDEKPPPPGMYGIFFYVFRGITVKSLLFVLMCSSCVFQ